MIRRTHAVGTTLLVLAAIACGPGRPSAPLTADDVIARAAENWGGMERLGGLSTLRVEMTFHEHDYLVTVDVARPNLVRTTGGDQYISVFDGAEAGFLKMTARDGTPTDPFRVEEEQVKDWELEKAWVFPAFFDHPAEYLGLRQVGEDSVHVLRVMLPLGARVDYYLDTESFLVVGGEALATIGETTWVSGRTFSGFQETDGILYPTTMEFFFGDADPEPGTFEGVEFNVTFPPDYFVIPDSIQ